MTNNKPLPLPPRSYLTDRDTGELVPAYGDKSDDNYCSRCGMFLFGKEARCKCIGKREKMEKRQAKIDAGLLSRTKTAAADDDADEPEPLSPVGNDDDNGLPVFQNLVRQQPALLLQQKTPSMKEREQVKPPVTFRRFGDGKALREAVFDRVLSSFRKLQPVANQKYTLALTDIDYSHDPQYTAKDIYNARLQNGTLARKMHGTWQLIDTQTGKVIQSRKSTVASVPYILNNGAFIKNGTQYYIRHQMRTKPGVYVHRKENGELIANVNALAHEGATHSYTLDPESGKFNMEVNKNAVPVFTFLKALGASDDEIKEAWGEDLFNINNKYAKPAMLAKLYGRFVRQRHISPGDTDTDERMSEKIRQAAEEISLHPDVTARTVGHPHTKLSKDVVLAATKKLIAIGRDEAESDSRGDIAFQHVMGPEDLFSERVDLDEGRIRRGLLQKLTFLSHNNPDLTKIPSGSLTPQLEGVITDSGLASPAEEINPYELYDKLYSITQMGRGAIGSDNAIPMTARAVHNSQFGLIDPIRTPESMRAGVDLYVAANAQKGSDGNLYTEVIDAKTGKRKMVSAVDLHNKVIAIKSDWDKHKGDVVPAFDTDRQPRYNIPKSQVDYLFPHMTGAFSPLSNLVPGLGTIKGQRVAMASRMALQALPIVKGEAPLVQSLMPDGNGKSFEDYIGKFSTVNARGSGVVTNVTDNAVTVKYADGKEHTHVLERHSPLNRKTMSHQTPVVQPGQQVKEGDLLARSNFTDNDGTLALGLNARTVLLPWRGRNHADAVTVSASFAKRMTSQHMYQHKIDWTDNVKQGKKTFMGAFPGKYSKEQLETIGDDGAVKIGTRVMPGDPLVLKAEINTKPTERIHRKGDHTLMDSALEWDHHDPGVVVDVFNSNKGVSVLVKTESPLRVGDKLAGRQGNKGVIAEIVPDDLCPQTPDGPAEVMYNTVGNIGRVNMGMIHELTLGKIAKKLGRPIKIESFSPDVEDWAEKVRQLAKEHGVNIKDVVIDPETNKPITGLGGKGISSGYLYIQKLHHSAEAKESARGLSRYTQDEAPARGGADGAKRVALMHTNALVSHGAYNFLAESKRIRGQKNDEYWGAFMRGYQPPEPDQPLMYKKFLAEMQGSGINVCPEAGRIKLLALTNKDVESLSGDREVKNAETIRWEKDKKPITGGLFDPQIFGEYGDKWGYIATPAPVLNPVMEEPARRMLGLTQAKLEAVMSGKENIGDYGTGVRGLSKALEAINVDKEIAQARITINSKSGTARDEAVKKLGFLKTAKETGIHPKDWMLDRIPVIPPRFRAVSEMAGTGTPLVADANYLYKQLIDHTSAVKALQEQVGENDDDHLTTYNLFKQVAGFADPSHPKLVKKRVKGLMRHVFGDGSTKFGMMQRTLLGSPVDMIGRNVIVPNPDLDMDSIGIPIDSAFEIYKTLIIRKLSQRGYPLHKAKEAWENRDKVAKQTLLDLTKERPVVMDRSPTLHKFGMMAFWPRLVKGDVLHVNPYVLGGFGADFDGDANYCTVIVKMSRALISSVLREYGDNCFENSHFQNFVNFVKEQNAYYGIIAPREIDSTLKEKKMPYKDLTVLSINGEELVTICNLEDFPHNPQRVDVSQGQFGQIDWYAVPDGVEILSYDEKTGAVVWAHPTLYSVHHGCEVEIAHTQNKRQMITDDDPRAIYGIDVNTYEYVRNTPTAALNSGMMIPRTKIVPESAGSIVTELDTAQCYGAIPRLRRLKDVIPVDFNLGYAIGAMVGDGWVTKSQVCLADKDGYVAGKLSAVFDDYVINGVKHGVIDTSANAIGNSVRHSWAAVELGNFLTYLLGRGCRNKRLPSWFLAAGINFRYGVFAGLMDTDGGVGYGKAKVKNRPQLTVNYTTTNLRLAYDAQILAMSLGISGRITATSTPAGLPCWALTFSSVDIKTWNGYGLQTPEKLKKIQEAVVDAESDAAAKADLVPISRPLAGYLAALFGAKKHPVTPEDKERRAFYMTLQPAKGFGRLSRSASRRIIEAVKKYGFNVDHPHWYRFQDFVKTANITWEYVVSVDKTKVAHTGYDLTVPGYETFADVNGVILSNTSNFQVPHSDAAVQDAVELMLPSRNLVEPGNNSSPAQSMTEDYILGLYEATRKPKTAGKVVKTFATKEDVMRAYHRGDLSVHDTVKVLT